MHACAPAQQRPLRTCAARVGGRDESDGGALACAVVGPDSRLQARRLCAGWGAAWLAGSAANTGMQALADGSPPQCSCPPPAAPHCLTLTWRQRADFVRPGLDALEPPGDAAQSSRGWGEQSTAGQEGRWQQQQRLLHPCHPATRCRHTAHQQSELTLHVPPCWAQGLHV